MWVTKILISSVKIRIFAQKRPNLAFLFILGQALLVWCPVGGLVGGFCAQAVSRKTPIYFILYFKQTNHCNALPQLYYRRKMFICNNKKKT